MSDKKQTIVAERGQRVRISTDYIVADTPEQASLVLENMRVMGITTPNYEQYGGATITLAIDGAGTEYVAFCARKQSTDTFGFYIIHIASGSEVPYSPFCTGRGTISNSGRWIAWTNKDFYKGMISGWVHYPAAVDYSAQINDLRAKVDDLDRRFKLLAADLAALKAGGANGGLTVEDQAALAWLRKLREVYHTA